MGSKVYTGRSPTFPWQDLPLTPEVAMSTRTIPGSHLPPGSKRSITCEVGCYYSAAPTASSRETVVSEVVYTSNVRIERQSGPIRLAYLPGEPNPVLFSVHGAIAEHYKVDPSRLGE